MQFGEDWPGIFIRGDNALALMLAIDGVLLAKEGQPEDVFAKMQLKSFRDTLMGCDDRLVGHDPNTEVQMLKPWDECLKDSS
jgi:hypothetical protein